MERTDKEHEEENKTGETKQGARGAGGGGGGGGGGGVLRLEEEEDEANAPRTPEQQLAERAIFARIGNNMGRSASAMVGPCTLQKLLSTPSPSMSGRAQGQTCR